MPCSHPRPRAALLSRPQRVVACIAVPQGSPETHPRDTQSPVAAAATPSQRAGDWRVRTTETMWPGLQPVGHATLADAWPRLSLSWAPGGAAAAAAPDSHGCALAVGLSQGVGGQATGHAWQRKHACSAASRSPPPALGLPGIPAIFRCRQDAGLIHLSLEQSRRDLHLHGCQKVAKL